MWRRAASLQSHCPLSGRAEAGGNHDFLAVVREFLNEYPQQGLVMVISDFLDDGSCEKALQYLADYGNELMLMQLWKDEDRTPPWTGEVRSGGCRSRFSSAHAHRRGGSEALHGGIRSLFRHSERNRAAQSGHIRRIARFDAA